MLTVTGKGSVRQRDLPAQMVVHFVTALALHMQSFHGEMLRFAVIGFLVPGGGVGLPVRLDSKQVIENTRRSKLSKRWKRGS
jgi:hypothetical protein